MSTSSVSNHTDSFSDMSLSDMEWLAEQMPGGFFIYKAERPLTILFVNQATCRIFGCNNVEEFQKLTGNTFDGMVYPEDFQEAQNTIDQQIEGDEDNKMDHVIYRIIRKDGEIRWIDDYGHYATLPGYGNVYYVFITDITDSRWMMEEQEKNHLLKDALEEAEQANIAKMSFLSNMSHEIRTPITAILGINDIIRSEFHNLDLLSYTNSIHHAGTSLLGLISDVLDFSKIESGKLEIIPEEYLLHDLITDVYNMVQFRAEEKGLAINIEVSPNLPQKLKGDDLRIKQVITNLLTNAIKYTEKGSVTLRALERGMDNQTIDIYFAVEDTGIGIHEEDMDKLFEMFTRVDVKRTHSIEGAGLGLPICSQLLGLLDSKLCVESKYNEGSVFSFVLNQEVVDQSPIGEFDLTMESQKGQSVYNNSFTFYAPKCRILVVDDTPLNLQVITGLLRQTNMQIDEAQSGVECLEKMKTYRYDLVFLDYRMPGMDGIETLERIHNQLSENALSTPIIALTACAFAGEKERMLEAGFTAYASKPIRIPELNEILLEQLPSDKIIPISEENKDDPSPNETKLPQIIYDIPWLNPKEALEYCGDDTLYLAALKKFTDTIGEKANLIKECLKKEDWELFIITMHSLKSTSKIIGAENFSDYARIFEIAGKEEDYEWIRSNIYEFLEEYRSLYWDLRDIF